MVFGQLSKAEMLAIVKEQALSKQKKKEKPVRTLQEKLKFYATFSFSLVAISGFSVLMFLVPFIVDPALATLTADFVEKPVECRVILSRAILGEEKIKENIFLTTPFHFEQPNLKLFAGQQTFMTFINGEISSAF